MTSGELQEIFSRAGYLLETRKAELLLRYEEKIKKYGKARLISFSTELEFVQKHLLDSASCLDAGLLNNSERLVDIGAGAGLPGIPLKIINEELELWLIESIKKKCDFLKVLINELELKKTRCLCQRAETLGHDPNFRGFFDVSTARAVSDLAVVLEFALPLLRIGGAHIAQVGSYSFDDLIRYKKIARKLGGEIQDVIRVKLPSIIDRSLIIIGKNEETPLVYPRRVGIPQKRPISLI